MSSHDRSGQCHDEHVHVTDFSRVGEAERGTQDELVLQLCPNIAGASGVSISCKYLIG